MNEQQFVDAHHLADFCETNERVIYSLRLEADPSPAHRFCAVIWRVHVAVMERHGFRIHLLPNGATTLRPVTM